MVRKVKKSNMLKLVGKKIVAVRGIVPRFQEKRKFPEISVDYVLFDDKKTFLQVEEQDYYTYHDCSSLAREIRIVEDKERWKNIYTDKKTYPNATEDLGW